MSNKLFRKFRKLIRNPKMFWRDFKPFKTLSHVISRPEGTTPPKVDAIVKKAPLPKTTIEFNQSGKVISRPKKAVVFLYSQYQQETGYKLLESIRQQDYLHFQPGSFHQSSFDIDINESSSQLCERIELLHNHKLTNMYALVLVNPPHNLVTAMRNYGSDLWVIVIFTTDHICDVEPDTNRIDALIAIKDSTYAKLPGIRRKVLVDSDSDIAKGLGILLHENVSKSPDMLLPILNANGYTPELLDFNPGQFQGIVRIKKHTDFHSLNLNQDLQKMVSYIESILILESVYMRYRTLCEEVESGSSPLRLIECCLIDGVLFNVQVNKNK